jgi:hemolysin activation/secretion protein
LGALLLGLSASVQLHAQAAETPAAPEPLDPGVIIERFEFSYGLAHPDLPALEDLKALTIRVTRDGEVLRAPNGAGVEEMRLDSIPAGSRFDAGALRGIAQDIVRWYNARDIYGVWVAFADLETTVGGVLDNRASDQRAANLVIWASQIAEVRTLARGKRIKPQVSINHRKHRRVAAQSPLQPPAKEGEPGSLFRQEPLNQFLYGLSLHPGRRVEASIASAGQPGKVVLDYLVNESKSWQVFSQANNFGTETTGDYRVRLGFQHNQLTNHDDIFNVDAISTPDLETYGTFLSYRIPVWRPAKLIARVYGSYGDFLASDATLENLRFAGKNWLGGLELTNYHTLWRRWQLVSVLGAQYNHYEIESSFGESRLTGGESDFLVPFLGATLTRDARWWSAFFSVRFEHTLDGYANLDTTTGIEQLGRLKVDSDWTSAKWQLGGTVYLDSLFHRDAVVHKLAHEVSFRAKGRMLLRGGRVIPQEQEPMGGALSIRGYPESVLSADEFINTTFEYAWHLPRSLTPGDPGKFYRWPFKWRPTKSGQDPDWDLTLRAFFDYGRRNVTPVPADSSASTDTPSVTALVDQDLNLMGTGVGITLLFKQNFSLRCDYGTALTGLRDDTKPTDQQVVMEKGNKQFYVVTSFAW